MLGPFLRSPGLLRVCAGLACWALSACTPTATTVTPPETVPMAATTPSRVSIADASASPVTFERIAAFPPPGWQVPRATDIAPDGSLVTYLMSESQSEEMALFAFDPKTKEHRVLLRASDLVDTGRKLSREEELRRERQRKRIQGVTGYSWAGESPTLLIPLGGDIFVRTPDGATKQLTRSEAPDIDPKICADGSKVAFVRDGELWVVDVASGHERQLTKDAPEGVTRGLSDFNGQEEFAEPSGLWWAPSCDAIAYLEVDEREVDRVPIMGYRDGNDLQQLRYPRAGTRNPEVRLGILRLSDHSTRWVQMPKADGLDAEHQYLGRLHFSKDGKALFVERLSRNQQRLALLRVDSRTGAAQHIITEKDDAWLELSDLGVLADGNLVWSALRDGHRHLELRSGESGEIMTRLTSGDWDVSRLVAIDETNKRVLFIANKDEVLGRQLYAVPLAGGDIVRLTHQRGVHEVSATHPEHGFIDIHSALDRLPRAVIADANGEPIGEIHVPEDADMAALKLRPARLVSIDGEDGQKLYGALLEPRDRKPGQRYPAVVMVYGGPGVQTVLDEYNPRPLWQHLADRGVVVFQLDNRGSTGRGHAFETPIYHHMGKVELADQLRGLDYLTSLDYVDADRVGIYGHSYGGYMAAMAMLRAPGRFEVGVSGSPVTRLALLRHRLHRALHGHAPGQPVRLRRQRPAPARPPPEGTPAVGSRPHG